MSSDARKSLAAKCSKCGSEKVAIAWHKTCWPHRGGCLFGDNAQPSGEHLHHYCQTCCFDWFEDVLDV